MLSAPHSEPVCVPVLPLPLSNAMPATWTAVAVVNRVPSSYAGTVHDSIEVTAAGVSASVGLHGGEGGMKAGVEIPGADDYTLGIAYMHTF